MIKKYEDIYRTEDPRKIQAFLDELDLEGVKDYVKSVVYRSKNPNRGPVAKVYPSLESRFFVSHKKQTINVYPYLFQIIREDGLNYGDFLSVVIDHEGKHAEDLYYAPFKMGTFGFIKFMPWVLEAEIRAYGNQEENFSRRGCSDLFMKEIVKQRIHKEYLLGSRDRAFAISF